MLASDTDLTASEARKRFYFVDSSGLVTTKRGGKLQSHKIPYARQDYEKIEDLLDIINVVKPTALIGLSGIGGAFNDQILEAMSKLNERPIIFSLSNPTANSECR
jgi:malate dehydrogenase (oxaloacetate-decarboxylating)(NADP+)